MNHKQTQDLINKVTALVYLDTCKEVADMIELRLKFGVGKRRMDYLLGELIKELRGE